MFHGGFVVGHIIIIIIIITMVMNCQQQMADHKEPTVDLCTIKLQLFTTLMMKVYGEQH